MRWYNLTCAAVLSSLSLITINPTNHLTGQQQAINDVDNFYVIGDSLSDDGALVGAGTQYFAGNKFLPKIQEIKMEEPYHNNQFCNGANSVTVAAKYFGKTLTPGWKFQKIPVVGKTYEQVGNNYAVGTARLGTSIFPGTFFVSAFTAGKQMEALFSQHKITNHDWVFFVMGANDLLSVMEGTTVPFLTWKLYLDAALFIEKMELISLVKHGVSNIVVTDVPDLSETPAYSKDSKTKEKAANVFNYFHSQWKNMIQSLKVDYAKQINDFELSAVVKETLSELGKKGMNIKEGASDINFYESFLSTGVLKPILKPGVTLDKVNHYFFWMGYTLLDTNYVDKWTN